MKQVTPMAKPVRRVKGDLITFKPGDMTGNIRNKLPMVEQGMKILAPRGEDFKKIADDFTTRRRLPYGQMRARMEMASSILATGGTNKMAARYAGVSIRQIKKYWQDAEFRQRIEEKRKVLMSRVQGRIVKELDRRTDQEEIVDMELMDLLRIFDRTVGGKDRAIGDTININTTYENIFEQILNSDAPEEGANFPDYGSQDLRLSEGSSPVE